jgi:mannose-6-phosphate isomerase-like protein (cupin superfamily)
VASRPENCNEKLVFNGVSILASLIRRKDGDHAMKKIGSGKLKLLQLDHEAHDSERHDYPEGLFVARGQARVVVDGQYVAINTGGMYIVPAGKIHSVETDGQGTVVIFD